MSAARWVWQLTCARCGKTWATVQGFPVGYRVCCSGCLLPGESSSDFGGDS